MNAITGKYAFLNDCPVVPVMVVERLDHAVPMARALVAGGLTNLEITLRTECALDAISAIANEVEGATVGAGTVLSTRQLDAVRSAGAQFVVTPGITTSLLAHSAERDIALLPGAVTASEIMTALEHGFHILKFFPAGTSGGAPAIKAFGGPFGEVTFMPTGGVNPNNVREYLALDNVIAAGGSWMLPAGLVAQGDWNAITDLAREAVRAATASDNA